jgi:hypothetical protein
MAATTASLQKRIEAEEARRKAGDDLSRAEISALRAEVKGDEAALTKALGDIATLQKTIAALTSSEADPVAALVPAGMKLLRRDPCTDPDFASLWGDGVPFDMVSASRMGLDPTGWEGGPARTFEVRATDTVAGQSGVRCENGKLDGARNGLASPTNPGGTFHWYSEGDHTFTVVRRVLPEGFPIGDPRFKTGMQIKEEQPGAYSDGGPGLEVQTNSDEHQLLNYWKKVWSCPARVGVAIVWALETVHSVDPAKGWARLTVLEDGEVVGRSPQIYGRNLSVQSVDDPAHGLKKGQVARSVLRAGLYQDAGLPGATIIGGPTEVWGAA